LLSDRHQLATPGNAALAPKEHIYLQQRFSDHAPQRMVGHE